jgi:transcriptional regulator with XRE-family HTH domain
MLTEFGKVLRKLRIEKGEMRLLDLARKLDKSASFISAVETGRKEIPDGFAVHVSRAMNLAPAELRELSKAADRTRREHRLTGKTEEQRELIANFARRLDEMDPVVIEKLRDILLKSSDGDEPFRRKRAGFEVPPKSAAVLRNNAEKVRSVFIDDNQVMFPIIDVLEFRLHKIVAEFEFQVRTREEMGDDEGSVPAGGNSLWLREDVYERACRGVGRDRFTACHELAHFLMHSHMQFARVRSDAPIFQDSEWQADCFAGALLMSRRHTSQFSTADEASVACGMSMSAGRYQWSIYQREKGGK